MCEAPRSRRKSVYLMLPGERYVWPKTADASMATKIERRPITVMMAAALVGAQGGSAAPGRGAILRFKDLMTWIRMQGVRISSPRIPKVCRG